MNIIAGQAIWDAMQDEKARHVPIGAGGYQSEALCKLQRSWAGRGIIGAQIVQSNYGWSVRYDSGLQNWGILRASRGAADPSHEAAVAFCREWVAEDPAGRYAWE
jgi:hypothetical protein